MSDWVLLEIHFGGGADKSAPWVSLMPITISRRSVVSGFFGEPAQARTRSEIAVRRICRPIVLVPISDQEFSLDRGKVPAAAGVAERVVARPHRIGEERSL